MGINLGNIPNLERDTGLLKTFQGKSLFFSKIKLSFKFNIYTPLGRIIS